MQSEDKLPQTTIDLIEGLDISQEKKGNCYAITKVLYSDFKRAPAFLLQNYLLEAIESFQDDVDKDISKFFPIAKSLTDSLGMKLSHGEKKD